MTALTRKCQYALRALYFLAREYGTGPISISRISANVNAPANFLESILLELKNKGVLESQRGSRGGYSFLTSPTRVTVGSIVRIIEGPLITLPCAMEQESPPCKDCRDAHSCQIRTLMRGIREAVAAILDQTTLLPACRPAAAPKHPKLTRGTRPSRFSDLDICDT